MDHFFHYAIQKDFKGQRKRTEATVLALHTPNPGSICGMPYVYPKHTYAPSPTICKPFAQLIVAPKTIIKERLYRTGGWTLIYTTDGVLGRWGEE